MLPHRKSANQFRARGVTLLEVSLAMGLLVFVSGMTYWFYASSLETQKTETEVGRKWRLARVIINQMADEIRQTSLTAHAGHSGLLGDPEAIRITSFRVPEKTVLPGGVNLNGEQVAQSDLMRVEYSLARHPDIVSDDGGYEQSLGLIRHEKVLDSVSADPDEITVDGEGADTGSNVTFDDETAIDTEFDDEEIGEGGGIDIDWEELYAPEIKFLRFCYFDGYNWGDKWHVTSGDYPIPQLVRVTIGFEGGPPYGEEFSSPEEMEYCECMNEDPPDCEPMPDDRMSIVVMLGLRDPLFRSRLPSEIARQTEDIPVEGEEEE